MTPVEPTTKDGAFTERSGRNQWQSLATRSTRRNRKRKPNPLHESVSRESGLLVQRQTARFRADWDGTVMEQRGRNRWQTFGSPKARKRLDLAPKTLPPAA